MFEHIVSAPDGDSGRLIIARRNGDAFFPVAEVPHRYGVTREDRMLEAKTVADALNRLTPEMYSDYRPDHRA